MFSVNAKCKMEFFYFNLIVYLLAFVCVSNLRDCVDLSHILWFVTSISDG